MRFIKLRIVLLTGLFSARFLDCSSQTSIPQQVDHYQRNLVKAVASPTSDEIGRYSQFPVDHKTGVPNITVPLFSASVRDISIQPSLSYNASGIKVDQYASWVGLGWNLNLGGSITRTVRGLPDDYNALEETDPRTGIKTYFYGWLANKQNNGVRVAKFIQTTTMDACAALYEIEGRDLYQQKQHVLDSEPDIFNIKLPEGSTSFIFDGDGIPRQLSLQDMKIEVLNYFPLSFRVTDNKGYVYIFNVEEVTETTTVTRRWNSNLTGGATNNYNYTSPACNECCEVNLDYQIHTQNGYQSTGRPYADAGATPVIRSQTTAWHLSKIISPTGAYVDFHYDPRHYNQTGLKPVRYRWSRRQSYSYPIDYSCPTSAIYSFERPATFAEHVTGELLFDKSGFKVSTKHLLSVIGYSGPGKSWSFKINTSHGVSRQDIAEDPNDTESSLGGLSYFVNINGDESQVNHVQFVQEFTTPGPRLSLKEVIIRGETYNSEIQKYAFTYKGGLPSYFSYKQDHWGYYNGIASTSGEQEYNPSSANKPNYSTTPTIYVYPGKTDEDRYRVTALPTVAGQTEIILYGKDRSATALADAGALTSMTLPTGGKATFTYETNEYYDTPTNTNKKCGGIRIKKITYEDAIDPSRNIEKNYTYNQASPNQTRSSGVLIYQPSYARGTAVGRNPNQPLGTVYSVNTVHFGDNNWFVYDHMASSISSTGNPSPTHMHDYFTLRKSESEGPLTDLNGACVGYTFVTVEEVGAGKTTYKYNSPKHYKDAAVATLVRTTGSYNGPSQPAVISTGGWGQIYPVGPGCLSLTSTGGTTARNVYPFPPMSDPTYNPTSGYPQYGMLTEEKAYNQAGSLARMVTYNYTTVVREGSAPKTIKGLVYGIQFAFLGYTDIYNLGMQPRAYGMYKYNTDLAIVLSSKTETIYSVNPPSTSGQSVTTQYAYNTGFVQPTEIKTTNSDGTEITERFKFPYNYSTSITSPNHEAGAVLDLKNYYMPGVVVEKITTIKKPGETVHKVISGSYIKFSNNFNEYSIQYPLYSGASQNSFTTRRIVSPQFKYSLALQSPKVLGSASPDFVWSEINSSGTGINIDPGYIVKESFRSNFDNGNVLLHSHIDGFQMFVWDHEETKIVASAVGTHIDKIAFGGFEADGKGNWDFNPAYISDRPKTGNKGYNLGAATSGIQSESLSAGRYKISYWATAPEKVIISGGTIFKHTQGETLQNFSPYGQLYNWTYFEALVDVPDYTTLKLTYSGSNPSGYTIDELRLHTEGSMMKSYSYKPGVGVTSENDENNIITRYKYDTNGRLIGVFDDKENPLKKFEYGYQKGF